MADLSLAKRRPVLEGKAGGSHAASLRPAEPASRISLRARSEDVAALSKALGLELPVKPKSSSVANGRIALWLGPDEWLIIDETGADLMAAVASSGVLHSATDVSHRNTAILISGSKADVAINSASTLDLSLAAFPVGAATRTLFGKVECVLYRTSETSFRMEVWRSFASFAWALLQDGANDAAF